MAAFSPEQARRIVGRLQQPAVFLNMTQGWPVLHWTAENLGQRLGDRTVRFRLGRKAETKVPLFESQCSYLDAKMDHFLAWVKGQAQEDAGPFCDFPSSEYWAYADYKYIAMLFADQPSMFEEVKWEVFGLEGRNGKDSTLWVGSKGANTPCHLDSYGCNLVLQVQGRKCWHLFPPEDTSTLYPTRVPYEESSVFSRVDVLHPDLTTFPAFTRARVHTVTLEPGQVLVVPRHWWHYVESLDDVTVSVNSWVELEDDHVARLGEAVTRTVVCALKRDHDAGDWLNPTEEAVPSHNDNMRYVNMALQACAAPQRTDPAAGDTRPAKRDSDGRVRRRAGEAVPFGPCLLPVGPQPRPHGDAPPGAPGEGPGETVTTDRLLDCLLHPDVIAMVTQLLLHSR
ncbi:HSPB1-associated protein 1 homolog [Entelurus aequoreus]|uniref:HSPB1-associated protein 1 homolog n=1 Tax=Entelurus aequoreus TaxID=161455 RepID=UPI002B1E3306|nr:HSPB1-associated protein 1 homolog [Entelurus aequoreus]